MVVSPSSFSSSLTTFTLPSITQHISTKLDSPTNYLNWVSHFTPILNAHELIGFVDGEESCPSKYVTNETGKVSSTINLDYSLWQKKDQCLLRWFNTILLDRVPSSLYGLKMARQVWTTMAIIYASQYKARNCNLKIQLQTLN
jgi:hypothetical protein